MYQDAVLSDGTRVSGEAQAIFRSLATLAQLTGESEFHGEDATALRMSLQSVKELVSELPFELAMVAASRILSYVEVARDHTVDVPSCERCGGELVSLGTRFSESGLSADLLELLEAALN